jgi:DNA-binding NarL/FixJ family response regulator
MAAGNAEFRRTLHELVDAARALLPIEIETAETSSVEQTREQIAEWGPDALLLDWSLAPSGMLDVVRDILAGDPELRLLVLLPETGREYREAVWRAGACACLPRHRADAEWLQAVLCVMYRARQREARLRAAAA